MKVLIILVLCGKVALAAETNVGPFDVDPATFPEPHSAVARDFFIAFQPPLSLRPAHYLGLSLPTRTGCKTGEKEWNGVGQRWRTAKRPVEFSTGRGLERALDQGSWIWSFIRKLLPSMVTVSA